MSDLMFDRVCFNFLLQSVLVLIVIFHKKKGALLQNETKWLKSKAVQWFSSCVVLLLLDVMSFYSHFLLGWAINRKLIETSFRKPTKDLILSKSVILAVWNIQFMIINSPFTYLKMTKICTLPLEKYPSYTLEYWIIMWNV